MKNLGNCVMGGVIAWLMIAPVTWAVDYGVIVDGGDWGNATTWTPSGGPPPSQTGRLLEVYGWRDSCSTPR